MLFSLRDLLAVSVQRFHPNVQDHHGHHAHRQQPAQNQHFGDQRINQKPAYELHGKTQRLDHLHVRLADLVGVVVLPEETLQDGRRLRLEHGVTDGEQRRAAEHVHPGHLRSAVTLVVGRNVPREQRHIEADVGERSHRHGHRTTKAATGHPPEQTRRQDVCAVEGGLDESCTNTAKEEEVKEIKKKVSETSARPGNNSDQ